MKYIFCFLVSLCLFFRVYAQENNTLTGGLKAGDRVPDLLIPGITNYSTPTVSISSFKGKLLIIDFWATWCAPCVAMMPKMEAMQKQFNDKVQFLPVSYQTQTEVSAFLGRLHLQGNLPEVTGDKVLVALFPHTYLPHYVWIDPDGRVLAITGYEDVTEVKIKAALNGFTNTLGTKKDVSIPYDAGKPLLVNGNGGNGANLFYHAMLTGYTAGIPSGYTITPLDSLSGRTITARNQSIPALYALAYCEDKRNIGRNRLVLEVQDSAQIVSKAHGSAYAIWMSQHHVYCYEVLTPPEMAAQGWRIMQQDLVRLFPQYTAALEMRNTPCWVLERTSAVDKLKSAGGTPAVTLDGYSADLKNTYLPQLTARLGVIYLQNSLPIVDETGYAGPIDMTLNAKLSDVDALNRELARYDLRLARKERPVEMLVIRDSHPSKFSTKPSL